MDNTHGFLPLRTVDLNAQQSTPSGSLPIGSFNGRSAQVETACTHMQPPPTYQESISEAPPTYQQFISEPPPAYTPVAGAHEITTLTNLVPDASFDHCFFELEQAYKTDFTKLVRILAPCTRSAAVRDLLPYITDEILAGTRTAAADKNFLALAERLIKFARAGQETLSQGIRGAREELSRLVVVTCMYYLEQKHHIEQGSKVATTKCETKPEKAKSEKACTADQPSYSAAMVRKEFFQKLLSATERCGRADARLKILKFVDKNQSGLKADLESQFPITSDLQLSKLRYTDIPGAVISREYAGRLDAYSKTYNMDLSDLVEQLGRTRSSLRRIVPDPMEDVMRTLARKARNKDFLPDRFFFNRTELFRDRNARCLLALMDYCQKQVFDPSQGCNIQSHAEPEADKKCQNDPGPVQTTLASQQDIQSVKNQFREILLANCVDHPRIHDQVCKFFEAS